MVFGISRKKRTKNKDSIQDLNIEIFKEKFELEELCYKKISDLESDEIEFMQKELKKSLKILNQSLYIVQIFSDN